MKLSDIKKMFELDPSLKYVTTRDVNNPDGAVIWTKLQEQSPDEIKQQIVSRNHSISDTIPDQDAARTPADFTDEKEILDIRRDYYVKGFTFEDIEVRRKMARRNGANARDVCAKGGLLDARLRGKLTEEELANQTEFSRHKRRSRRRRSRRNPTPYSSDQIEKLVAATYLAPEGEIRRKMLLKIVDGDKTRIPSAEAKLSELREPIRLFRAGVPPHQIQLPKVPKCHRDTVRNLMDDPFRLQKIISQLKDSLI